MDSGYYAACTAVKAQSQALEIAANNIANVNTSGYRGQIPSFESLLVANRSMPPDAWSDLLNHFGTVNGTRVDLRQGNLEQSGNPLDFAIEGPGFFTVQTRAGTLYTRNGRFHVSGRGQLVSAAGDPVLGETGPITIENDGTVAISGDGTVSVNGALIGKLRLVEIADPNSIAPVGGSYYSAPAKDARPAISSVVRQGMLESSNVNAVSAMIGLITAQRQAEMAERAMTAYYADFNRIAADELPRV